MPFGLIGSEARKLKQRAVQQALLAQQAPVVAPVDTAVPPAQTRRGMIGGMSPLAQDVGRRGMDRMPTVSREATKLSKQGMALPAPVAGPVNDGGVFRFFGYKPDETGQELGEWMFSDRQAVQNAKAEQLARQEADAAERRKVQQEAEITRLMGSKDPQDRMRLAYMMGDSKLGENLATNFAAANVNAGDSRVSGFGDVYTAPKFGVDGGYGYTQTPEGIEWQDQRGQNYAEDNDAAVTAETIRNNNMTNSLGRDRLGVDRDRLTFDQGEATRKAAQEADGGAVFEGSQLATIYNKSMADLEEDKARQGDLDTIAGASTQFMDVVKGDDWLQGAGIFNDLMQAGSTRTSEAKKLTDTIAPLIRRPGSGGNSDADVTMFKNSVVSVNNTPQSNKLATEQAVALQQRGQQYVNFLTRTIDPRDPQSKQKADAMWNLYKQENNLFDSQSGKVKTVPTFDDWLNVKMGKAPPANSFLGKRVQSAVSAIAPPQDDVSDLLEKYLQ